jgi:uncharacterized membrane protein
MREDDEPGFLAAVEAVRGFIGSIVVLILSLAFLVMGHTAGRIVGAVLFILWLALGLKTVRKRRFRREA